MMEFLAFYLSDFWVWSGLTIGAAVILSQLVNLVIGTLAAILGTPIEIGKTVNQVKEKKDG